MAMANGVGLINTNRNEVLVDAGIIAGFMTSTYVVMTMAPHVKPLAKSLIRRSTPYLCQLKHKAYLVPGQIRSCIKVPEMIWNVAGYVRRKKGKKNLVRWLGSNLPDFLFSPTPRICVLMQGVESISTNEIINGRQIRPALSELEDLNDEGIVIAYAKASDTESEIMDTMHEFGETWGNSIKFDPCLAGCSTPNRAYSPVQEWLSMHPMQSGIDDSALQEANAAKIVTLEAELNKMKALCEMILKNQTASVVAAMETVTVPSKPVILQQPVPGAPAPPPPPPPPPPMMHSQPATTKAIKLKTKSELESLKPETGSGLAKSFPPSMSDILKGLSGVKLKPVARSPGGTPLKDKRDSENSDPGSLIAAALKKRFARIQSPIQTVDTDDENDLSANDKENQPFSSGTDDSFTHSPSYYQFGGAAKQKPSPVSASEALALKMNRSNRSLETTLNTSRKRKSVDGNSSVENSPVPLFGQHLLKRRVSASLQKKKQARLSLSLREENGNAEED